MTVDAVFPHTDIGSGMYESFYLRAFAPSEPVGAWIRYTVHKRPGRAPRGSLWCTVFDARTGRPFMAKHTTEELSLPSDGWISVGDSSLGATRAEGTCGDARWSLRISDEEQELRHLKQEWMYRTSLPRTKLTSPIPAATFEGTIDVPGRTLDVHGWSGMVGHNWGSQHAERWIWLHGTGFDADPSTWLDVALGRVRVAGRLTPWLASGAICVDGRRVRLGGLGARGVRVLESAARCTLSIPGEDGVRIDAHVDTPPNSSAGWRYADPDGGEHDVVNCSIATLTLNVRRRGAAGLLLHTDHGAAYELGMREHDHGVPLAPFADG